MGTAGPQPRAPDLPDLNRERLSSSPLRSGARGWGPEAEGKKDGGKEEEVTLIKSRDPHLAGGEQNQVVEKKSAGRLLTLEVIHNRSL